MALRQSCSAFAVTEQQRTMIMSGAMSPARETTLWPAALVSASWISDGTLRLRCHAIGDAPCGFDMLVSILGNSVTVKSRCSADPLTGEYDGVASGVRREESV